MSRWPHVRLAQLWPSALVLLALLGVLAEIYHLRRTRRLPSQRAGVESILQFQQLTYVAEPFEEPRRLPIELVDRGLPLALQEHYTAQVSDYHPARTDKHSRAPVAPSSQREFTRKERKESAPCEANAADCQQPTRGTTMPLRLYSPTYERVGADGSVEPLYRMDSDVEAEAIDALEAMDDELLRLIPSAFPRKHQDPADSHFAPEMKSSYVAEDAGLDGSADRTASLSTDLPVHKDLPVHNERRRNGNSRVGIPRQRAVGVTADRKVAERLPVRRERDRTTGQLFSSPPPSHEPPVGPAAAITPWVPTKWSRSTAGDAAPRPVDETLLR